MKFSTDSVFELSRTLDMKNEQLTRGVSSLLASVGTYENQVKLINSRTEQLANAVEELKTRGYTTYSLVNLSMDIEKAQEVKTAAKATFIAVARVMGLEVEEA